ncbi:hypothetical protein [Streptomyces caelestis]|uniref:hypothetical protein n=1 Tax=Streptomyces caelestis TaxID=36816 RepID=UPI0036651001
MPHTPLIGDLPGIKALTTGRTRAAAPLDVVAVPRRVPPLTGGGRVRISACAGGRNTTRLRVGAHGAAATRPDGRGGVTAARAAVADEARPHGTAVVTAASCRDDRRVGGPSTALPAEPGLFEEAGRPATAHGRAAAV